MVLIDHVAPPPAPPALDGKSRDTLRLTWEGRRWGRRRLTTTAGREIALALPTGTVLAVGAIIWVDRDWYLEVAGEPEPVIVVVPRGRDEALRIAFEVGNRHFSVALFGDLLLVPDDIAMSQLLDRLDALWERAEAVYTPMGFGNGHTHGADDDGHAHAHVHPHLHTHGHPHGH